MAVPGGTDVAVHAIAAAVAERGSFVLVWWNKLRDEERLYVTERM